MPASLLRAEPQRKACWRLPPGRPLALPARFRDDVQERRLRLRLELAIAAAAGGPEDLW